MVLGLILGGLTLFLVWKIARAVARAKQGKLDLRNQAALLATTQTQDDAPDKGEHALAAPLGMEMTVSSPSKWEQFHHPAIRGVSFPDGSIVALSVAEADGPKGAKIRLSRDTEISTGTTDYDRCCVGLLRLAGATAPVRLPHAIAFDTSGKASRPAAKVTAEAAISYTDAEGHHSTRRVSILGFEPVGERRRTDEVFLHAWCWQSNGYRTFRLSRVTALTDAATGKAVSKTDWVWEKAGLRFPPGAPLLVTR